MRPRSSGADHAPGARIAALAEARAALAAGASPATALQAVGHQPELAAVASAVRLGASVARVAATVDTGDPSLDLLVRALGVAEHAGAGGIDAVEQALAAVREEADLQRLLRARTAQARGTARLLGWLPFVAWSLFALADPRVLGYPATPLGAVTTTAAVLMAVGGQLWSRRIVGRAEEVAAAAEPLRPPPPGWQWRRGAAVAVPAGVVLVLAAGAGLAIGGTAILLLAAARPTAPRRAGRRPAQAGGSTEAVELVAVALRAGLSPSAALAVVAPLAPPVARPALEAGARRMQGGWDAAAALSGTGLDAVGSVLDASTRWGAPAAPALTRLATDLRADRRSLAEEAAERTQLHLVFPTTLLTLPAFLLGVVPPLVWAAFNGASASTHLP